jgi:hypothetical protein
MDDFDLKWAMLIFSAKPADIANVKIWLKDNIDSDYDCIISEIDPNGSLCIKFKCFEGVQGAASIRSGAGRGGVKKADSILITYANNEGLTIRGKAMVEM